MKVIVRGAVYGSAWRHECSQAAHVIFMGVVLVLASPVFAEPLDSAVAAYNRRDYASALDIWKPRAGNGDALAQKSLFLLYRDGKGVRKDPALAVSWLRKAAEQGDAEAQNILGVQYYVGQVVPKDDAVAVQWYHKSAEQGDPNGQYHLGAMYDSGRGVPRNHVIAARWIGMGACQGQPGAQYTLATMYGAGEGVPKDRMMAYVWTNLSAGGGNELARTYRVELEALMSRADVVEGQRLSRKMGAEINCPAGIPN
jgi:TPR repeat protein